MYIFVTVKGQYRERCKGREAEKRFRKGEGGIRPFRDIVQGA